MTEKELRNKVYSVAKSFKEDFDKTGNHNAVIDTYNSHEPLARGYRMSTKDPWCAAFVSAVSIKAGLTDIIPTECSCSKMIELLKGIGEWVEYDSYTPSIGDLVFYDWDDKQNFSITDNTGAPDHVGIVVSVIGDQFVIMEGNMSGDRIGYRYLEQNGRYIRGWGVPDYMSKEVDESRVPSDWCKEEWEKVCKAGILDGSYPKEPLTRQQYAVTLVRLGLIK